MNIPEIITPYFSEDQLFSVSKYVLGVSRNVRAQQLDARKKQRKIIMISGLSGAGKDSIVDGLTSKAKELARVKTLTTRERRIEETEENDRYERITTGQFEDYLRKGQILEHTEYAGGFYGTKKGSIQEVLASGRTPVLRVDPRGASFYLDKWHKTGDVFTRATLIYFFVVPLSMEVLRKRLLERSGDADLVEKRLEQSQNDITHIGEAEYIVINENGKLDEVVDQIITLI